MRIEREIEIEKRLRIKMPSSAIESLLREHLDIPPEYRLGTMHYYRGLSSALSNTLMIWTEKGEEEE